MDEKKTNILIISDGASGSALAKKLSKNPQCGKIFIAPSNNIKSEIWENIDIRQDDLTSILRFVLENDIHLTIPLSEIALKSDIISFFHANGQNIFGAVSGACQFALNKIKGKHFLYKIHAQTAKFGVFDKLQTAQEWLANANFPVMIRCAETQTNAEDKLVCTTPALALDFTEKLFSQGESGILIEEFAIGHNFTSYFITDGYEAISIGNAANFKFEKDGNSGIYTNGMGCYIPDYKISDVVCSRIKNIVDKTLEYMDKKGTPYIGILGVECTLTGEDKFYVNEFKPFLQDCDAEAVLNGIDDDLIKIFMACINGLFADEYEKIEINETSSVSVVVNSKYTDRIIKGIDNTDGIDFISVKQLPDGNVLTKGNPAFVITSNASTITRAKALLSEELDEISFDGMEYRHDIIKPVDF